MPSKDECEWKWKSPKGNSPARDALRIEMGGGRMREPAHDVENMHPESFKNKYEGTDWWYNYLDVKREFINDCKNYNPHYSGHAEGWGGAKTTRSKKNRSKKNRKTRKARK